jgi:uncharacterized protein YlaI
MYFKKVNKCWLCNKVDSLTEHHIVPKILRKKVPELNNYTVLLCRACHIKIHILLPRYFSDGSYKWKGSKKLNIIHPEWFESSEDNILDWDGEEDGRRRNNNNN